MDEIRSFFDNFASDFKQFNGELIAKRFVEPFTVVNSDGEITTLASKVEVAKYFQGYLDKYKSNGVVSCAYKDLEAVKIGAACSVVSVTWSLLGHDRCVISEWRESYNIVHKPGNIKVYSTCDY